MGKPKKRLAFEALSFDYPRQVYFACERCALCCGDTEQRIRSVFLLGIEADRIARKTFRNIGEFAEKLQGFGLYVYVMRKTDLGKCIFLRENVCTIYQARPLVCRFYPFELNLEGDKYVFAYTRECPGIGKGSRVKKEYLRILFEMALGLMKKDRENLHEVVG
jgi:hypothetical protein